MFVAGIIFSKNYLYPNLEFGLLDIALKPEVLGVIRNTNESNDNLDTFVEKWAYDTLSLDFRKIDLTFLDTDGSMIKS